MYRRSVAFLALAGLTALPISSWAVDHCKAKVDRRDGTILVSAANITGVLHWGDAAVLETRSFSNAATCLDPAKAKAKKCELAPAGDATRITPPGLCTLYVKDDASECAAYIKGCTPDRTPPGTVAPYAGTTAPQGWLLCDGSAIGRTTYAGLFAAIGSAHGEGDGVNTFNLPDYRGRFLRGVDDGAGRDPDAGSRTAMNAGGATGDEVGSVEAEATALPGNPFATSMDGLHSHLAPTTTGTGGAYEVGGIYPEASGFDYVAAAPTSADGLHSHTVASGGDAETRPVNAAVNWIIKY